MYIPSCHTSSLAKSLGTLHGFKRVCGFEKKLIFLKHDDIIEFMLPKQNDSSRRGEYDYKEVNAVEYAWFE